MSVLTLKVDEVMRTLSAESSNPFVVHDKEVDIVRFAINSGFADIVLDGQVALRVMYQRPGETEVRAQTLTYYDTDGLHNYYDWQLAQSDLAKNGSLMVALCILDISGGEVSEWHTTPCAVRVLSTIHTDDSDEADETITPTVAQRVAVLETMIQRVASGAPIVVANASAMTDTDQIYVLSTDGYWYYYDGSAWVAGGEYGAVATDTTLTQAGVPADAKKVGDEISAIKADLVDNYVSKKGEHQVTPQNLEGMQYTKTTGEVEGDNIFSSDMLFEEGYYISINTNTGTVAHSTNSSFNAYCIPVEQNSKYKFTQARFVVLATGNTVGSPAIGELQSNISEIETGLATYMFLSINVNSINDIYVKPVTTSVVYSDFILPDWLVDNLPIPTVEEKPKFATVTGNISSGKNLQLTSPRNNLRKGERIVFDGKITSFSTLTIGLTYGTGLAATQLKNYFVIDGTNISYYATNTSTAVTVAHGLTLSNNIQIIWEMSAIATCKITLISDGNLFVHEFTNFTRQAIGNPFVLSNGTVLTNCKLTWTCIDIDKQIWMFGDSYFAYSETRWTYYLHQYGYDDNCLLDGFPGEGSVNGRVAFNNLLQFGTPKFAVWCLGMNDTTDSETAPAMPWVTNRDLFLQYCQNNNVTPIFGTIPTVPTINHEQKNAWVRSSGYRYIDFAKAVGAQSDGAWYSGMLANDGVHPTAQGAKALFARVLVDFPEIMLIN